MKKKRTLFCIVSMLNVMLLLGCQKEELVELQQKEEVRDEVNEDQKEMIFIHIYGHVNKPGVYEMTLGSRIFEAIEEAGGATEDGNTNALNLAKLLEDGEQIYIPSFQEAEMQQNKEQNDGKVSINHGTKEELMTLTGIGEAKAESIIAYREENGGFHTVEELKNIPGIKDGVYNKIEDSIKL
ncbi:helix-hairpin-helix domain-containing protein [Aequitasia blattaphilus]|uniref:Helix-hairpin-helix domain-containing protein n=1 Tax=Aequitasia blattaphilus TaxID=2949332 RepID=A0ABT1E8X6_9FIRM|nr:helix-hairpin-helix domain-containing protein [Aequitasia blattaphilus]MCP1102282.1 helix-hairpin-helix domain-containing protein [Aequitasia blattaphilus]MCR8614922.1 helix-hairpin-helix domain-containing protein [Aequitasia blattaphilus]